MEKEFKFNDKTEMRADILLMESRRVMPMIVRAINRRDELSVDEYAFAAANAIDATFGHRSQIPEPSYLVAEAIALAMGADATKNSRLGALFETTLRLRIRGEMSKLEHGESE